MALWHGLIINRPSIRLVREGIADLGLKLFVPSETRHRRGACVEWPLVPYAFAKGDVDREAVVRVRGVLRFLRTAGKEYAYATEEQVIAMQTACGTLKAADHGGLKAGDRVRLRRLALGSLEATVREIDGRRVRIGVSMLGKVHEQWVDADYLEVARVPIMG